MQLKDSLTFNVEIDENSPRVHITGTVDSSPAGLDELIALVSKLCRGLNQ